MPKNMSESLKRTPLYDTHKKIGAKLIEFGGWEMPVQYSNIIEEHLTVRSKVGIFDLSHMGEIEIFLLRITKWPLATFKCMAYLVLDYIVF